MSSSAFRSVSSLPPFSFCGTGEWALGSEEVPPKKLSESVIRRKLVSNGKLGGADPLEEYFSDSPEGKVVRDLQEGFLKHLQDQIQMGIQEKEREIAELRKEKK